MWYRATIEEWDGSKSSVSLKISDDLKIRYLKCSPVGETCKCGDALIGEETIALEHSCDISYLKIINPAIAGFETQFPGREVRISNS